MIATTIDYHKLQDLRQNVYITISGCRSSQSPEFSFFAVGVVENPRFAAEIVILSVIVREIEVFPVLAVTLPFSIVGH